MRREEARNEIDLDPKWVVGSRYLAALMAEVVKEIELASLGDDREGSDRP